jgi:hypothetical protein
MGKADAEVNLVAGDEDEAVGEYEYEREDEYEDGYKYQYECGYEGLWVGTLGATEVPEKANKSADTTTDQEPAQDDDPVRMEEEAGQYECEYEGLWVGTIGATELPEKTDKSTGITADRKPAQDDDPVKMEEETTEDEQWDMETGQPDWRANGAKNPLHGSSYRPPGHRARPPRPTETGRPKLKAGPRADPDRRWEEARHNAWLRQLLSDDSSGEDEDEERYERFAESRKWTTELYGIPQHPTATSGRECSV